MRRTRDTTNDSDQPPTDFGIINHVDITPNDTTFANLYPLNLLLGVGKALSLRNHGNQETFWRGGASKDEVMLSVQGHGDWRRQDDLVNLVSSNRNIARLICDGLVLLAGQIEDLCSCE